MTTPPDNNTLNPPTEPSAQRRFSVMVVEDEALIALDLERRLLRAGYDCVGIARSCEDAVQLFQEHPVDLVLMDIFIQGPLDGIETAKAIAKLGDVPVIFLTAYADDVTVGRAAAASAYGYLLKPFDDRTLLATLRVARERHAADAQLRLLNAAVSAATVGILLVEAAGDERRIRFVNDAFSAISGVPREMIIGQRPCFLARNPDDPAVLRLLDAVENFTAAHETVPGRRANGELFWSTVSISPVANRSGQVDYLLVFHMDVSGQREAEAVLAQNQRLELMGQLTAGIAHDFNNILGVILACTELARTGVEDEAVRRDLDEVSDAAQRGASLTQKLLVFARRNDAPQTQDADLAHVVEQTRQMATRLAGPAVTLQVRIDPQPMFVPLDTTSLEQILLNLVTNARDAMPDGGELAIAVTRPVEDTERFAGQAYVRLEVSDNGTGMDAETAQRLFEPFFTTKMPGRGSGLGLSTCRALVEKVGGTIRVRSAPGQGATFSLDFPVAETAANEDYMHVNERVDGDAGGALCLLVEDETSLRRAGARALRAAGFVVVEAANGKTAISELNKLGPKLRLLICDMVLPDCSGSDIVAHAQKTCPHAEALVTTGFFDQSSEPLGRGVSLLWKPFTGSTLARRALDIVGNQLALSGMRLAVPTQAALAVAPMPAPVPQAHSPAVLLIDDDEPLRRGLGSLLEARGLTVVQLGTGAAALEAIETTEFQVALVDVNLPDMHGLDLLPAFRKKDPLLPILVMTGEPTVEIAQQALRRRATGFLTKPLMPSVFVEEVERTANEAMLARLQQKLLVSMAGSAPMLLDLAATEQNFKESLAGLYMVFQPIVRAYDRSVFAFEALMRSRGPYTNPAELLAAAEALGQIGELGRVVRQRIVAVLLEQPDRFEPIFVNLHALELRHDILLAEDEPLLPFAARIVLEVTERAQVSSAHNLADTLQVLRLAGYRVAIDDLGEGYAALSWLIKLTPDIAKLDMSLVRNIETSRIKRELVGAIVNVCRRARTLVVAEGVESAEEAQILQDLGCDLLQGYYFARPGPPFPAVT